MNKHVLSLLFSLIIVCLPTHNVSAMAHWTYPGWIYYLNKTSSKFHNMISGSHYINATRNNMTVQSTISHAVTLGATANCSLSGGWGAVNASIGYTANRSETYTKADAITITVRPGYEGWNEYGVKRDTWTGKCIYRTDRGDEINPKSITITSPRHKVVVAKTRKVR